MRSLLREADTYDLPPSDAVATSDTAAAAPPERDHGNTAVSFDHYRLLSVIGEGGFGEVWEAEQNEPVRRRVAIKVIKAGMDSASVVARFEAERQALAVMNHPCIARVFDAGTTPPELGARPYFVMELVRGDPISAFCDLNKLSLADRVQLMVKVCEAVQHAHAKGVIHRDLKPGNILVQYQDGVPTPKVIDFGVAKAIDQRLTEKTIFTERGQLIGTPEYMSPEQAEMSGTDIDTRSDIYSLGVVLYELLTGTLPFDSTSLRSAGYAEIQRIIREIEPPKPSTRLSGDRSAAPLRRGPDDRQSATRTLRRDLDWVVMKCLEKPRERRYDTARGLADDLQRFLRHEPVSAGPPSVGYQAQKFVRLGPQGHAGSPSRPWHRG
ncbi:MAG: serine/threonine-protein kinase [Planctomycetota bacterium]